MYLRSFLVYLIPVYVDVVDAIIMSCTYFHFHWIVLLVDMLWHLYKKSCCWLSIGLFQWVHLIKHPLPWAIGLPVAIQCTWNLDPSVHWNATGERIVVPVWFQWSSSCFPVVFQCVPIMQINTGSPLEHHSVLASASVVPVAPQCTYGSSGLPVCSNDAN